MQLNYILISIFKSNIILFQRMSQSLKQIPVNKTVVFWSPIEGEDVLVRTGTMKEGNSFFHAILHACSKEYTNMDKSDRKKFVKRLRASMVGKIDKESWEEIGGGIIAKIPFQENVINILVNFYLFLDNDSKAKGSSTKRVITNLVGGDVQKLELYNIITELIPIKSGFENILSSVYKKTEDGNISECCDAIIEETLVYLKNKEEIKSISKEKSKYIQSIVSNFLKTVLKEAEDSAFKQYINGLQTITEDVDNCTVDFIADRFKRDIYFLDTKKRMPYNPVISAKNLQRRSKSIIILCVGKNHYEIVGRLLPGNSIQREFDHDDDLINKMFTFLVEPKRISDKYPELVKFLPVDDYNSSDSESDESSKDSYNYSTDDDDNDDNNDDDNDNDNDNDDDDE